MDFLKRNGYCLPDKWIILPNGVNVKLFSAATVPNNSERKIITYTGQFTSWKNLPLLFDALQHLPENFTLRIAGGKASQSESSKYIKQLTEQFKVQNRVEYLGFVHPSELIERAIKGSSVLALPLGDNNMAKFATSPMKLVEYMSTSIPVVAVGHPSVIGLAGQNTVHLTEANAVKFANAIITAVNEAESEKRKRLAAMNHIAAQFSHEIRAERFNFWLDQITTSVTNLKK
jgi:glycosyltransferase involved in cell wall biosynthesis